MLGALDALGLAGTTSVIVQGDHGFSLGRHDRWSKYNLYEDATRVPLLFAVPGRGAAARRRRCREPRRDADHPRPVGCETRQAARRWWADRCRGAPRRCCQAHGRCRRDGHLCRPPASPPATRPGVLHARGPPRAARRRVTDAVPHRSAVARGAERRRGKRVCWHGRLVVCHRTRRGAPSSSVRALRAAGVDGASSAVRQAATGRSASKASRPRMAACGASRTVHARRAPHAPS